MLESAVFEGNVVPRGACRAMQGVGHGWSGGVAEYDARLHWVGFDFACRLNAGTMGLRSD